MTENGQQNPLEYCIYIDESGDHSFNRLGDPPFRFLALLGLWFRKDRYSAFAEDLQNFKTDLFGPKIIGLHRTEIIGRKGAFSVLERVEVNERFKAGLFAVIRRADFRRILIAIDKKSVPESQRPRFDPYHRCLFALLNRYSELLAELNGFGTVTAETRGPLPDRMLKEEYCNAYEIVRGCLEREHKRMPVTSKAIHLEPKEANLAGLELADLLAHPCKQEFLMKQGYIPECH